MSEVNAIPQVVPEATEHIDVLIIGAGISGIGAAHHLAAKCPGKSFAILESKASFGGASIPTRAFAPIVTCNPLVMTSNSGPGRPSPAVAPFWIILRAPLKTTIW